MPTLLVLHPAYGTISCPQLSRYARQFDGLKLVLADDEPSASDEGLFDEVIEIPPPERLTESYEILRRWCQQHRPEGIFLQSERGLLLGSLLAREFGLKGPPVEAAHLCSNKYRQRLALSDAGIGNPEFSLVESAADVRRFAGRFGFPLVIKCIISNMARLVTLVRSEEDIDSAVAKMLEGISQSLDVARLTGFAQIAGVDLGCDPRRQFLVESFIEGDMFETDGLVIGSKPFCFGVTEQIQSVNPAFFIEGYLLPAECVESKPAEAVSDSIIGAFGLRDSAFSIEMRATGDRIRIIEVNGRLGWDEGFGEMFEVRTHRDRILQTLQIALGVTPELLRDESRFAALAYRSCYYNGIVEELPTHEELAQLEHSNLRLGLATHKGAHFFATPHPEAYPHIVWALATHSTSSHGAYEAARQAVDGLRITIRPV